MRPPPPTSQSQPHQASAAQRSVMNSTQRLHLVGNSGLVLARLLFPVMERGKTGSLRSDGGGTPRQGIRLTGPSVLLLRSDVTPLNAPLSLQSSACWIRWILLSWATSFFLSFFGFWFKPNLNSLELKNFSHVIFYIWMADAVVRLPKQSGGSRLCSRAANTENKQVDQCAKCACLHVLIHIFSRASAHLLHVCLYLWCCSLWELSWTREQLVLRSWSRPATWSGPALHVKSGKTLLWHGNKVKQDWKLKVFF